MAASWGAEQIDQESNLRVVNDVGTSESGESVSSITESRAVLKDVGDIFKSLTSWR